MKTGDRVKYKGYVQCILHDGTMTQAELEEEGTIESISSFADNSGTATVRLDNGSLQDFNLSQLSLARMTITETRRSTEGVCYSSHKLLEENE